VSTAVYLVFDAAKVQHWTDALDSPAEGQFQKREEAMEFARKIKGVIYPFTLAGEGLLIFAGSMKRSPRVVGK